MTDPPGNGVDGFCCRVEFKDDRQVERVEKKDQNGAVHVLEFNPPVSVVHPRVTTLGTGIDGALRRTSTTYEVRGMREEGTSYDNATAGGAVNEVNGRCSVMEDADPAKTVPWPFLNPRRETK